MVITTFQNPACFPPTNQNIPPTRDTSLCLNLSAQNKKNVLGKKNKSGLTKNQYWAYLSNIDPQKGKTYASQNDLGSNPNLLNLPRNGNGGMSCKNN